MRIAVAQTIPVPGNIPANIATHIRLVEQAAACGARVVIFPELSLTGYEPALAAKLATTPADQRFDVLQQLSTAREIIIGAGLPTPAADGVCISMLLFHPQGERQLYSKQYLHSDETGHFVSGRNPTGLIRGTPFAPAICYELSVPEHAAAACNEGARVYLVSAAKTAAGTVQAHEALVQTAQHHSLTVLLANCAGTCDGNSCGGRSAIWDNTGKLVGQLNEAAEGFLVCDKGVAGCT